MSIISILSSVVKTGIKARETIWVNGFLERRLIKFYVGEGFKINPKSISSLAESGKAKNGTSKDEEVQAKSALLCALTSQLKEYNDIYEKALETDDYEDLYDAILSSCDLRGKSGFQKLYDLLK